MRCKILDINKHNTIKKAEIDRLTNHKYNIYIYDEVSSTNDVLKKYAIEGAEDNTVIIANSQTKGKGRLGRSFFSPADTGIYFSILLRRNFSPDEAMFLTPAAAVCVANALGKYTQNKVEIKWVNDIYINDRKICGILSESAFNNDNTKTEFAIIGIGINLTKPLQDFPAEISSKAGFLLDNSCVLDNIKTAVIADILNEFTSILNVFTLNSIYDAYVSRSWLTSKTVIADTGSEIFEAEVVGVDKSMRLVLKKTDGSIVAINCGEVNLKTL